MPQFGSFSLEPSGSPPAKAYRHGSSHSSCAINRTRSKRILASHHALDVTPATDASVGSSAAKRQGSCKPHRLHIIPGDCGPERWSLGSLGGMNMQIKVNTDDNVQGREKFARRVGAEISSAPPSSKAATTWVAVVGCRGARKVCSINLGKLDEWRTSVRQPPV